MTTLDPVPGIADQENQPELPLEYGPPVVRPPADTRLDQLAAEYASLKPLADEYKARLKTIVDGIKSELVQLHPNQSEILLIGTTTPLPLRVQAVTKWQLDTKALKAENPGLYVAYARRATSWELRQVEA